MMKRQVSDNLTTTIGSMENTEGAGPNSAFLAVWGNLCQHQPTQRSLAANTI